MEFRRRIEIETFSISAARQSRKKKGGGNRFRGISIIESPGSYRWGVKIDRKGRLASRVGVKVTSANRF